MDNWSSIIGELERRGWSLTAIAKAVGSHTSSVSDIKQGRTRAPTGMAAVRLHALWSTGAMPPAGEKAAA